MSKAFTREDEAPTPMVSRSLPAIDPSAPRYITPEGFERLKRELSELQARPTPLEPVAKQRLDWLTGLLPMLRVLSPSEEGEGIRFGMWLELEDEDGERLTFRLVGPDEADPSAGLISIDSPLARALLGREEGESVQVQRPRGAREYTVIAVRGVSS